jgi:hypothetical protein
MLLLHVVGAELVSITSAKALKSSVTMSRSIILFASNSVEYVVGGVMVVLEI